MTGYVGLGGRMMLRGFVAGIGFCCAVGFSVAGGLPEALDGGTSVTVEGVKEPIVYFDAGRLTVEGKGFDDTVTTWSRVSERYRGKVSEGVWNNGMMSAGVAVRFVTDSPMIFASWEAPRGFMNHMAPTGSNGLDLYVWREDDWFYAGTGVPRGTTSTQDLRIWPRQFGVAQEELAAEGALREYLLFLPTYSPTNALRLGVPAGSEIGPGRADRYGDRKPIVFYGTSISQGACASRAGLGHVEQLRRMLDYPTVNLGFSGSGRGELVMAEMIGEIEASLYVIETVPNMSGDLIRENTLPFLRRLRELRPETPILMVGSPNMPLNAENNGLWRKEFERARGEGLEGLHFLDGNGLYGGMDNPTTDGVHPTDLGFTMMAREYEPVLREILGMGDR